jgi:NADH-quinone oxidoreductase subunit E
MPRSCDILSAPSSPDLDSILARYPAHPRYLLAALQDIQATFRHIPREAMVRVAAHMGIPESRVYGVATFYKALSLVPKGRKTVKVCMGTACHLRGAPGVLEALENALGITPGNTTEDGAFSLETVNCLGACALAPVVMVEDTPYGAMAPAKVTSMLEKERDHAV